MTSRIELAKLSDRQETGRENLAHSEPSVTSIFRGTFQHSLDDKGRVSLPATFRQALNERQVSGLVITNFICDGARCLEGYSLPAWKEFEVRLGERSKFDPQLRKLENYYLARASECTVDSNGRINIPAHLRTYAGLERDVIFTSSLNGFRIWDKRVWDMVFQEAEVALLENPGLFLGVDLRDERNKR